MAEILITSIGGLAALLTSLSYLPQVRKAWHPGSTDDLSLKMLGALTTGLVLWVIYGLSKGDWILTAANGTGTALTGAVLAFKVQDTLRK
jgi:MtN3 and saliva related transmembrane protein